MQFSGVVVATTDGTVSYPEGPLALEEPGRYAFVCFLPKGITDEQIQQLAQETAPGEEPSFPAGPPHFTLGIPPRLFGYVARGTGDSRHEVAVRFGLEPVPDGCRLTMAGGGSCQVASPGSLRPCSSGCSCVRTARH